MHKCTDRNKIYLPSNSSSASQLSLPKFGNPVLPPLCCAYEVTTEYEVCYSNMCSHQVPTQISMFHTRIVHMPTVSTSIPQPSNYTPPPLSSRIRLSLSPVNILALERSRRFYITRILQFFFSFFNFFFFLVSYLFI